MPDSEIHCRAFLFMRLKQKQKVMSENEVAVATGRMAYTQHEVAAMLGVSYLSVHRLIQRGKLKANRALRRPLIAASEVQRFLAEE